MKKTIIFIVISVFMAAGYGFAQDCGSCPSKSKCGVTSTDKKAEKVYVPKKNNNAEKLYHKKDRCELPDPVAMDLREAVKKGYKPCTHCFPPEKKKTETEPEEK